MIHGGGFGVLEKLEKISFHACQFSLISDISD